MEPPTSGETILSDSLHLTQISTPIDPPATQEVEQPTLCEREKDNSITQATELHSAASSERSIATVTLDREELQCILIESARLAFAQLVTAQSRLTCS